MRSKLLLSCVVLLVIVRAAGALPIVKLEADGTFPNVHEIYVTPGTAVRLVYSISEVTDLNAFQNDMTITGDFTGLSVTDAGTWWGAQPDTAVSLQAPGVTGYHLLVGEVVVPPPDPPFAFTSATEATLAYIDITPQSGQVVVDLLSLLGNGSGFGAVNMWWGADPADMDPMWDIDIDLDNSLPKVTINTTLFGASPDTVTVEDGPGGAVAKQFLFDVVVQDIVDLWGWDFYAANPTDGPGTTKPQIIGAAEGGWWLYDYWAFGWPSWGFTASGEDGQPPILGTPPLMQSGSGPLVELTVGYDGCAVGQYTLTFALVELTTVIGVAPDLLVLPIGHTVVPLAIIVETGQAPSLGSPAWEEEPHATAIDTITMTAAQATDNHSPANEIQYEFRVDGGAPQGWQSSRDYTDTGLGTNTEHTYEYHARDGVVLIRVL
ncbi:hypothetical protein ACFL09_04555, partial [Planctomycetota bacterium]